MAHDGHAEDTHFVVSEQDFCFFKEDAAAHTQFLSEEEAKTCMWNHFDEITDCMEEGQEKREFKAQCD